MTYDGEVDPDGNPQRKRRGSSSLAWWAVIEPDTFTLEEYHRLRAEANGEGKG